MPQTETQTIENLWNASHRPPMESFCFASGLLLRLLKNEAGAAESDRRGTIAMTLDQRRVCVVRDRVI